MTVPFADITDLLNLETTSFECIEGASPQRSGDTDELDQGDGSWLQADTRKTEVAMTHKYHVLEKAAAEADHANCPVRGLHAGVDVDSTATNYWIDDVNVDKPEKGHWSMTVQFRTWEDVESSVGTMTRSDAGLS